MLRFEREFEERPILQLYVLYNIKYINLGRSYCEYFLLSIKFSIITSMCHKLECYAILILRRSRRLGGIEFAARCLRTCNKVAEVFDYTPHVIGCHFRRDVIEIGKGVFTLCGIIMRCILEPSRNMLLRFSSD